jgi:hypothetical protein
MGHDWKLGCSGNPPLCCNSWLRICWTPIAEIALSLIAWYPTGVGDAMTSLRIPAGSPLRNRKVVSSLPAIYPAPQANSLNFAMY